MASAGRTNVSAAARAFRDRAELDTQFPARYAGQDYQSAPHQADGAGFGRAHACTALGGDDVRIHGHRAISGQSTAAGDVSAGIQGNAAKREYVSCELRTGAESRGTTHHKKHIFILAIGKNNRGTACCGERTSDLKNEHSIAITVVIEGQCPRQLSGSLEKIYAVSEVLAT
jgi:hypothetical protein